MNRSIIFKIVLTLVLIGAVIGLGVLAYNAGITQGMALGSQAQAGDAARAPYPFYPMAYPYPYFGFGGFGFLGCLVPLFLVFLIFAALRGLFWHGPHGWRHMHHGLWGVGPNGEKYEPGRDVPQMFKEWHRRAHEETSTTPTEQ
jgi:hypothetical protein